VLSDEKGDLSLKSHAILILRAPVERYLPYPAVLDMLSNEALRHTQREVDEAARKLLLGKVALGMLR
jgi:hypothetical protein